MILGYYGLKISHDEIYRSILKTDKEASFNSEMALFARRKGFAVDCFAYNFYYTDPEDKKLSKKELLYKLERKLKKSNRDKYYDQMLESTIRCIKEGVKYTIQKPNFNIFVSYLGQKTPLIVSVNYAALHNKQGDPFESHDIVLVGVENKKFSYIDPKHAKEEKISYDDLLFSIFQGRLRLPAPIC